MIATNGASHWERHPEAEAWLLARLGEIVEALPPVRRLAADMLTRSGTRLVDWVDHLVLADGDRPRGQLLDLGFLPEPVVAPPGDAVLHHPGTVLPRFLLRADTGLPPGQVVAAAILVDSIDDFCMARQVSGPVEGAPLSPLRRARLWANALGEFQVVERRGFAGFAPVDTPPDHSHSILLAAGRWASRPRTSQDAHADMQAALSLARSLSRDLGVDSAAWLVFSCERRYWQQRTRAGQVQKERQDALGLGWANHDHYAFRSSRAHFPVLIEILEALGFQSRERFYAGQEAGWGAQVMEQPQCRIAVFADVDLTPDEVEFDFAHRPLEPLPVLGTIGLWCALHGEAMLSAGPHHLAARFDFDAVTAGLAEWGIKMMHPFSQFDHLRQAFTQGERWPVASERLDSLAAAGQITPEQLRQFTRAGALGSHLENIQRGDGFKGFNQHRVSDIIRRTDPRRAGV